MSSICRSPGVHQHGDYSYRHRGRFIDVASTGKRQAANGFSTSDFGR